MWRGSLGEPNTFGSRKRRKKRKERVREGERERERVRGRKTERHRRDRHRDMNDARVSISPDVARNRSHCGVVVRLLNSHLCKPGSIPGRGRSRIFACGNPVSPALSFRHRSIVASLHPQLSRPRC
ncbi:hypothetical protein PR048_002691 [Dryococelus australis]|uniref:Uncharacterized protein n=1 Tax=Dryococelus australis TaxID=614101 RepID=A0ABQ9IKW4_9NEOP|nr:hypothetical protein PR048_002691 [Dryococelus australis]